MNTYFAAAETIHDTMEQLVSNLNSLTIASDRAQRGEGCGLTIASKTFSWKWSSRYILHEGTDLTGIYT